MAPPCILIIDDDPPIRRAVRHAVEGEAGRVLEAETGRRGIDLVAAERPDLVVLDLGLPDVDGVTVCREIRGWSSVPIIVLSARDADREKVELLEAGADDYVTKPFSPDELRARVRAQLRRARSVSTEEPVIEADGLEIDLAHRLIRRDGADVHLTPTEWQVLRALLAHRGRPLTHDQLFKAVWNQAAGDPQAYLRVHVANLRRKIERDTLRPQHILTEAGVGYRFTAATEMARRTGSGAPTGSRDDG